MDDLDSLLLALGINDNPQEEQQSAPQTNVDVDLGDSIRGTSQSEPTEEQATTIYEGTEAVEAISSTLGEWIQELTSRGILGQLSTTFPLETVNSIDVDTIETVENPSLDIGVVHDPFYDDATTAASTESPQLENVSF